MSPTNWGVAPPAEAEQAAPDPHLPQRPMTWPSAADWTFVPPDVFGTFGADLNPPHTSSRYHLWVLIAVLQGLAATEDMALLGQAVYGTWHPLSTRR